MADTPEEIQKRYEDEAKSYREVAPLVNFDLDGFFGIFERMIDRFFPDRNSEIKVLDIGAGNGMFTELVLKKYPNAKITMFDFSPEMLNSAKSYFKSININEDNVKYEVGDFIVGSLPEGPFDLVVSSYALHHIRTEEELINVFLKINRVLKEKTGTFLCIDMYLGSLKEERDYQVKNANKRWFENFGSEETAKEWGNIIEQEDTPATIPMIVMALYKCYSKSKSIPLINDSIGTLAFMYGLTKLSLEEIKERGLYDFVYSWRFGNLCDQKNVHEIGSLNFVEKKM